MIAKFHQIITTGYVIVLPYKDSGSDMVLVGLLRGSFMFMADLCREVQGSHEVDFMTASSYGSGMSTTRDVKILKDLDEDIRGKDVLIANCCHSGREAMCAARRHAPAASLHRPLTPSLTA